MNTQPTDRSSYVQITINGDIFINTEVDESRLDFIEDQLDQILNAVEVLITKGIKMAGELDAVKAAVTHNGEVTASAITLIQGIKAALDAAIASGDPAALTALSDQLGTQDKALADAIAANTPAQPQPAAPAA